MELILYLLLFVLGIIFFILSTEQSESTHDITNTHQFQFSFLSLIVWAALALNSFNITIPSSSQTYDYTFIGLSLAFFGLSLLNTIVLMFYGTYNTLFKVASPELKKG